MLVVPFLPASNIFFNVGFVLAERTLYIPSAGYCLLVVIGIQKLCNRIPVQYLLPAYVALLWLYFARSWIRSDQWRSETALFRSALHVCPLNAKVHYNIAKNAADAGNSTLAQYEYEEALRYCFRSSEIKYGVYEKVFVHLAVAIFAFKYQISRVQIY